jgi:predicted ATP-grasp superfamily ATP-dependent carboligase
MSTTELKDALKTGTQNDGSTSTASNTEEFNKLKSDNEKLEKERNEALQKAAEVQFEADFNATTSIYPLAADFKDQIKEKTKLGLTAEDATILILKKENKLLTRDEINASENRGEGLGGSSVTIRSSGQKKDGKKSLADLEQEFKDAEAKGEITFGSGGIAR